MQRFFAHSRFFRYYAFYATPAIHTGREDDRMRC